VAFCIEGGFQRGDTARQSGVLSGKSGFVGPQVHDVPDSPTNGEHSGSYEVRPEWGEDAGHWGKSGKSTV
jgi:hypothetical protein